jgi:DNA-binding LacI/PurR family transcriptional regulator
VRQPVDEMGARLASDLLAQIADPEMTPSRVVLGTSLVVRASA